MRRNSTKVLFHFDSLVDLHLAVVYALQKDYPSGGSNPHINYSFLHQSKKDLKQFRVYGIGKNIVQECFKSKTMRDSYQTVIDAYLDDEFDRVIQDAPITMMLRLIAAFSRVKDKAVIPYIFCEDERQVRIARSLIKTLNVKIIKEDPKKIDLNSFARFIIGDIHDMDEFNLPQYLHIAVLNYGCNLQVVDKLPIVNREFANRYGLTNSIEVIDSYRDVTPPNYLKEDIP